MSTYKKRSTVGHDLKLNEANAGVFKQNAGKENLLSSSKEPIIMYSYLRTDH